MDPLISKVLPVVGKIYKSFEEASKITSEEITVRCPENRGIYSISFEIKKGIRRDLLRKISTPVHNLENVKLTGLPFFTSENKAVTSTRNQFDINFKDLSKDIEMFVAEVEFTLGDRNYLDGFVQRSSQTESITDSKNEYWMHAQLKNLQALKTKYGDVNLRDLDFFVDVAVHEDVKTQLPSSFIDDIKIVDAWLSESNREMKHKYSMEHMRHSKKTNYGGNERIFLRQLNELFAPTKFCSFVDVQHPFHYSNCEKGGDFLDLSQFMNFPRSIKVISRTNLSYSNPASEGKLIYNKQALRNEIKTIFD